jgi:hypothetical protein
MIRRKPYPSDVSDEEWSLIAPYLTLMREDAKQREHALRELFDGLRYLVRYGIAWRAMPNDLPTWFAVYQQAQRWLAAGVFETACSGFAGGPASGGWTPRGADSGDHRQPDLGFDAGERPASGL